MFTEKSEILVFAIYVAKTSLLEWFSLGVQKHAYTSNIVVLSRVCACLWLNDSVCVHCLFFVCCMYHC